MRQKSGKFTESPGYKLARPLDTAFAHLPMALEYMRHMAGYPHLVQLGKGKLKAIKADRSHFYLFSARVLRQALVAKTKVGGKLDQWSNDKGSSNNTKNSHIDVTAIDTALTALEQIDSRMASILELRYFAHLNSKEIAQALALSERVVTCELRFGRAWMTSRLSCGEMKAP